MKNIRLFAAIILMWSLLGCTTVGKGGSENIKSIPSGKGMVLFSTSTDETNLVFHTRFRLVDGATRKIYDKVIIFIDGKQLESNFTTEHANVRTLTLPEGIYFFYPVLGSGAYTKAPLYKFTVKKGVITYIGNFHLSDKSIFEWRLSKYDRDTNYFFSKNSEMRATQIDKQVVEISVMSTDNQFVTNGVIFEAP